VISQEPDVCYDVCRVTENVNNMSVMALSLDGVIFYVYHTMVWDKEMSNWFVLLQIAIRYQLPDKHNFAGLIK